MARIILVGQRTDWLHLAQIAASADLRITACPTGGPVLETLTLQSPDLIFVDGALTDLTCTDFIARVHHMAPTLPVVVALPMEAPDRLAVLEAGACDLLRAPVEPLEFVTRVHTMLGLLLRSSDLRPIPASDIATPPFEMRSQRAALIAAIDALVARSDVATSSHVLHLLHLGAVADVNAEFGRAIGDRLIEATASALRLAVPAAARVTRVTGDCFAIVEDDVAAPVGISELAERLGHAAAGPFEIAGERLTSTTAIGIARYPRDGRTGEALYRSAVQALLQARATRHDHAIIEAGEAAVPDASDSHEDLAVALARAIGGPELGLVFQPQVDLSTGAFSAVEAFVRWIRPGHGNVAPRTLFQIAGTGTLLGRLSDEILARAIEAHDTLSRAGLGDIRISLNVSPAQLDLIALERGTGSRFVPEGRRIEFEITGAFASDDHYVPALTALRAEGFGLCLDCSGTETIPERPRIAIDRIKLDAQDPDRMAAKAAFAQALQCPIIGGNVEEAGQLTRLRALDVQAAQGYYIQRPVPLDEFIALARSASIERDG